MCLYAVEPKLSLTNFLYSILTCKRTNMKEEEEVQDGREEEINSI